MTTRAKELAERWRKTGNVTDSDIDWMVNRLDAIDNAVPGEVGEIRERHHAYMGRPTRHKDHPVVVQFADDIATLLAIVQRQAGEIAEEAANHGIANKLWQDAEKERDAARAEVEWLKVALAERSPGLREALNREESAHLATRAEFDEARAEFDEARAEIERLRLEIVALKAQHDHLADTRMKATAEIEHLTERLRKMQHGEAEALKIMATEKQRADVLAEGVRLWKEAARLYNDPAPYRDAVTWLRMHGHLVGDGK